MRSFVVSFIRCSDEQLVARFTVKASIVEDACGKAIALYNATPNSDYISLYDCNFRVDEV